jgi:hypothetical protein
MRYSLSLAAASSRFKQPQLFVCARNKSAPHTVACHRIDIDIPNNAAIAHRACGVKPA